MSGSALLKLPTLILIFVLAACTAPEKTDGPKTAHTQKPKASHHLGRNLSNFPRLTLQAPERSTHAGLYGPEAPGPECLVGLSSMATQQMLGRPDFKRRDSPAEIWQYRESGCLLDVFLYLNEDNYRVSHVEVRGHSIKKILGAACLLEVLEN